VAYKPGVSDTRESPALDIIGLLMQQGARVVYSDPYVPEITVLGETLTSQPLTSELLEAADCVVVATNHAEFDYEMIERRARVIVDTRNAFAGLAREVPAVIGL
jgi:UDP-N-acetyl-D-glucosamine dehydrogenase